MAQLFRSYPDALRNTVAVAKRCSGFNLPGYLAGRYRFPEAPTPPGYDAQSWLRRLCEESASRRYWSVNAKVRERLDKEFGLIGRHGLAGFFLVYHPIVELARECMLELGYGHLETPLEWLPPGRGRCSSVSLLVGYLIGLSHLDPLEYGLTLDRFLSSETAAPPDIDLDFPRDIRERLILRVIEEWGWDHAALAPVQPSAIAGRYVAHWDKDSVDDAGVLKIDLLALGALSQMQRVVRLVRQRTGTEPDLSRIDYRDPGVFDDLGRGDTVGVFQVESAAQMQTIVRTRPRNIYDWRWR